MGLGIYNIFYFTLDHKALEHFLACVCVLARAHYSLTNKNWLCYLQL